MLSRTQKIGEFPLRVSRTEKELYEEFLASEEAEIAREKREYLLQAKQKPGRSSFPPPGSPDAHPFPSSRDGNINHPL
jgi:hypothetical protein